MKTSISEDIKSKVLADLSTANLKFQMTYPGDRPDRQPVHTVYGGANLFKADTCVKMGEIALKNLLTYAPNFVELAKVLELKDYQHLPSGIQEIEQLTKKLEKLPEAERKAETGALAFSIYNKIIAKLRREPVEDF